MTTAEYYNSSQEFREYVDRVAHNRGIAASELLKHAMIREVMEYYKQRGENK